MLTLVPDASTAPQAAERQDPGAVFLDLGALALRLLDQTPLAMLLGDAPQTVRFANAAARRLLAAGDGLQLTGDKLVPTAPATARALRSAWLRAGSCTERRDAGGAPTHWVSAERPSGKPAYQIAFGACPDLAPLTVIVHLFDPSVPGAFDPDCLYELYGLTPSEAEVAVAIAQGQRVASIARASGRATSTVRNLLKRAMTKTGTSRQHELAALLWRGAAGWFAR